MSKIVGRNKHNQICIDSLSLQTYLENMFMECETERDIEFIFNNIVAYSEELAEKTRERICK